MARPEADLYHERISRRQVWLSSRQALSTGLNSADTNTDPRRMLATSADELKGYKVALKNLTKGLQVTCADNEEYLMAHAEREEFAYPDSFSPLS